MTKLRNKIVLVLLALCLVVCAGLFVACGGDDKTKDNSVKYTVTVMAGDAAAEGVQVTVKKGSATLGTPKTTDSNGKAEFKLAEDAGYTVTLANLPRGYKVADGAVLKFDSERKLDVVLEEKPASYTIKLVNPDNTAYTAAGVLVGICKGNNCLDLVEPDANGIVKIYDAEMTDYHIQIKNLPAGYAFESDGNYAIHQNASGNYTESDGTAMVPVYVELTDAVVEQTITIYPVNVIQFTNDNKLSDADLVGDYSYVEGATAHKMSIDVAANTTVYYEYTADYSGEYKFYTSNLELNYKLNESFLLGDSYLSGNGMAPVSAVLEKGAKYYFNITNNGEESVTVELIMSTPYATYQTVSGVGTYKAEVNKQGKNAAIELEPTAGTAYKLTVTGNGAIQQVTSSYMVEYTEFTEADYTNSKELTVKYTADMQGSLYFAVSVKADTYPASVDVKIEKAGTCANENIVVQPTNLTQTADNEDDFNYELAPVAMNATVVKGTDGKYHLGTATGPVVYVNLMGTIGASRYPYNAYELVYMEYATEFRVSLYVFDVTTDEDKAAMDKGNTYKDFRTALRGFADYKGNGAIPDDNDLADEYYAKYVNADGLYPLDDVLKEYLELAAPQLGTEWLFACYYYAEWTEPDPIVGTYKTEDNAFVLEIEKFGELTVKEEGEAFAFGTWTKSGDDYVFTCVDTFGDECQLSYADGIITYVDFMGPMTFMPSDGDDEEEDPEPDFATLFSNEMSRVDNTINAAKLGLYNDGSCILWQFNGWTYDKISTARWGANEAGTEVTITNITVMEDYEFTVNAAYSVDYEHMAGVITVTITEGEGEDETTTTYTFYMPLQA